MAQNSAQGWRIATINGLLLAAYFVPAWMISIVRTAIYPLHGIYERSHVGPVRFINETFQLSMLGTMRFAWLFVLAKLVVAGALLLFTVLTFRAKEPDHSAGDEALALAVTIGCVISMGGAVAAQLVGEVDALRLHATEALMMLGALGLLVVDSHSYGVPRREIAPVSEPILAPVAEAA
jgi:hypothetical protein